MNEEQKAMYNTAYDMGFATLNACFSVLYNDNSINDKAKKK